VIERVLALAVLALAVGCTDIPAAPLRPPEPPAAERIDPPPPAPREFRAAWVATVANIDWPSKPGLSARAQRAEAIVLLDRARAIGLNALILQVRPAGDALYASALEPWSEVLSGEQGRPPAPAGEAPFDPLAFWVQEAHRRALELHAWFNPYRARHSAAKSPLAAPHLAVRQPALAKRYGDQLWFDPGEAAAAAQTLAVVADVVRRYDIDGVHIDDYFYPYPVAVNGTDVPFPDDDSYARYRLNDGPLSRDDWRRANVDTLVQTLYRTVHEIKPWLRVGISPFGIGRPDRRPPGIAGFSQFDKLYADVERWLDQGWLDYLAPQLYWPIDRAGQEFGPLLDYWISQNRLQRQMWPGLYTSQVPANWPAREIVEQVSLTRSRAPLAAGAPAADGAAGSAAGASGHIHFSLAALAQDRAGLATLLQMGPYARPALVPAMPWLGDTPPASPILRRTAGGLRIEGPAAAARWAVWRRVGGIWRFEVQAAQDRDLDAAGASAFAVATVDRQGNLSEVQVMRLP
jgi:uncharacterized lipoprotein YddW (UPF0748 family)